MRHNRRIELGGKRNKEGTGFASVETWLSDDPLVPPVGFSVALDSGENLTVYMSANEAGSVANVLRYVANCHRIRQRDKRRAQRMKTPEAQAEVDEAAGVPPSKWMYQCGGCKEWVGPYTGTMSPDICEWCDGREFGEVPMPWDTWTRNHVH